MLLRQALKTNRVVVGQGACSTGIYGIERALRDRIDQLDKSEWGQRLDQLMATIAADLEAELKTLPGIHPARAGVAEPSWLVRACSSALVQKGRDLIGARAA